VGEQSDAATAQRLAQIRVGEQAIDAYLRGVQAKA